MVLSGVIDPPNQWRFLRLDWRLKTIVNVDIHEDVLHQFTTISTLGLIIPRSASVFCLLLLLLYMRSLTSYKSAQQASRHVLRLIDPHPTSSLQHHRHLKFTTPSSRSLSKPINPTFIHSLTHKPQLPQPWQATTKQAPTAPQQAATPPSAKPGTAPNTPPKP
jgi:hypothetical protein